MSFLMDLLDNVIVKKNFCYIFAQKLSNALLLGYIKYIGLQVGWFCIYQRSLSLSLIQAYFFILIKFHVHFSFKYS